MAFGTGGRNWVRQILPGYGGEYVERDALHEYTHPTYGVGFSFKSALIGVLLFVAILVAVYVIFT